MRGKIAAAVIAIWLVLTFFAAAPFCSAGDSSLSYQLLNQSGKVAYTLNVVIPESLGSYYSGLSHKSAANDDFPKFVTPYALKQIADRLREIYPDDEDFANGVLTIIHQIPYVETIPAYYPVETMLRQGGDCDLLALIGASIMKAGGLDIMLLHYADEEHMNLGVHLAEAPKHARLDIYSLENNGIKYYVAESTTSNWQEGWRVGECPEDLQNVTAQIITLENSEQTAPGQVSASFQQLQPTALTLDASPSLITEGGTIALKGNLTPALPRENVTFYLSANGSPWTMLNSTITQANGMFEYSWKSEATGFCKVEASWAGNGQYAGTTSQTQNTTIIPNYIIATAAVAIIAIILSVAVVASRKKSQPQIENAQTDAEPELPVYLLSIMH
jgi:hypothetical protein